MALFSGKLMKQQLDDLTQFAESLPSQRMAGLYVGYEEDRLQIHPKRSTVNIARLS
jgi:hypothetical protein